MAGLQCGGDLGLRGSDFSTEMKPVYEGRGSDKGWPQANENRSVQGLVIGSSADLSVACKMVSIRSQYSNGKAGRP